MLSEPRIQPEQQQDIDYAKELVAQSVTMETRLSREVLSIVESTAMSTARLMGLGNEDAVNIESTLTMRSMLDTVNMKGTVVTGDGNTDGNHSFQQGEILGTGLPSVGNTVFDLDIALDPVEGTNLVAKGLPNAITTIAVTHSGGMLKCPKTYMNKLVVGAAARGRCDIQAPAKYNLNVIALSMNRDVTDLTVVILDRERNNDLIQEVRECGARIKLISDGDVLPAIASALKDTGIHAVMGIGGASEGILASAALKCLGGEIQAQFRWRDNADREQAEALGLSLSEDTVYFMEDLVPAQELVFAASGITSGDILKGVRFFGDGCRTNSLVMTNQTCMVRFVDTVHLGGDEHDRGPVKFGS